MTDAPDDVRTAQELAPLHDLIRNTIANHQYVIGDTIEHLVTQLTVAVATHLGAAVRGIPAELIELDTARRQLSAVREWVDTYGIDHDAEATLRSILDYPQARR